MSWNAEGLRRKLLEVQRWLSDKKVDVVAIQEAQMPANKTINIPGFQTASVTRRARGRRADGAVKGGDVAIYIRDGLHFQRLEDRPLDGSDDVTEWCGVRLFLPSSSQQASQPSIDIHNFYRPPIRPGENDDRVDNFALSLRTNSDCIVTGDFNAHHPSWDHRCDDADDVGQRLADWIASGDWHTLNSGAPTHADYRGNTGAPDVTACNRGLARRCEWTVGEDLGSDHLPQLIEVTCHGGRPRRIRKTKWAFHKADWDGFSAGIETVLESTPPPPDASTEQLLGLFNRVLLYQSTTAIPRGARADPRPWALDPELVEAVAERREARDAMKQDRSRAAKDRWLEAKRRAAKVEEEAKTRSFREFASTTLNKPTNIGRVTKVLRKMEGSVQACPGHALQGDRGLAVEDLEKATSFVRTYSRVSRQVGFRRGRSAEENLGRMIQTVQDGWNKPKPRGKPVDGVTAEKFVLMAYDFSRAYDVIDHRMLQLKLLREEAVDIHQLRSGHWARSEQYLHRIGRRPTPECAQCDDKECPAGRCLVCSEAADTPAHVLLECPCLYGPRLRALGNIIGAAHDVRRDDVVAALAAGYMAHKSRSATLPLRR
ncbi:RNA-directed DNA polymerase from mobile element jockey [Amphibalanus amphitrite]|uniref:RNA-directed DNA polymerase from mobile element jockey n=1 Tax=Amphibalanus amphitrite TaxID=1232801 RepID=A0A6A4X272_AMPAM|nr:RNA-directed DNA polymerase from mobile element jockey [Amphibalanus amphitrite]